MGDVHYALHVACVIEITNPMALAPLPCAPHSVMGVSDYRGEVVPVVDLRARFGLAPVAATRKTKWIVVDVAGRAVALVVDAVTEVFGTGGADLRPLPSLGGDEARGIAGVTRHAGRMVFVLDVEPLRELTDPLACVGQIGPGAGLPLLPWQAPA
ncbi:MAG: chemotaxis protein CheW [Polyangiaceae bacterium]|nr:chemotaxis protein CheW [Polyangiaceae bacterium]